jgi:hypothetical protein
MNHPRTQTWIAAELGALSAAALLLLGFTLGRQGAGRAARPTSHVQVRELGPVSEAAPSATKAPQTVAETPRTPARLGGSDPSPAKRVAKRTGHASSTETKARTRTPRRSSPAASAPSQKIARRHLSAPKRVARRTVTPPKPVPFERPRRLAEADTDTDETPRAERRRTHEPSELRRRNREPSKDRPRSRRGRRRTITPPAEAPRPVRIARSEPRREADTTSTAPISSPAPSSSAWERYERIRHGR